MHRLIGWSLALTCFLGAHSAHSQPQTECFGVYAGPDFQRLGNRAAEAALNEIATGQQLTDQQLLNIFRISLSYLIKKWDPRLVRDAEIVTQQDAMACFPSFNLAITNNAKRREDQQKQQDYFRRQADLYRQEQKQRSERAEKSSRPEFILGRAYTQYIIVKRCKDAREGYISIYISEAEYRRARDSIKSIEAKIKNNNPNLDTDGVWDAAVSVAATQNVVDRDICQRYLATLELGGRSADPSIKKPEKDF